MKKRGWILVWAVLGLQSCLTHYLVPSEVRLQLDNGTEDSVANLRVVGEGVPTLVWIADTLAPEEKSRVGVQEMVGTFSWVISVRNADCSGTNCWQDVHLGTHHVEGGSILWLLRHDSKNWSIQAK